MPDCIYMKVSEVPDSAVIGHSDGVLDVCAINRSVALTVNEQDPFFMTPDRAKALAAWLVVYADIAEANPEE